MLRFVIVLTMVCIIAALVLGITYNVTKPLIAAQNEREKKEALEKVLPGADEYRQKFLEGKEHYKGYQNGKLIGYAIFADGDGYSGNIHVLIGINNDEKITGVEVLSQQETPGLGARCVEIKPREKQPWFLKQFKGKSPSELSLKNIEAITGATITTEAIIKAVKEEAGAFSKSK